MSIFEAFRRAMLGLALIGALGIVVGAAFLGYCAYTLPLTHAVAEAPPAATVYLSSLDKPVAARGVYRGEKLTADHLPSNLVQAVVAIEDRRFYSHGGIDPRGMLRAASRNLWGSRGIEGGSTITQQLARLTYLSTERTLRRKVQEIMTPRPSAISARRPAISMLPSRRCWPGWSALPRSLRRAAICPPRSGVPNSCCTRWSIPALSTKLAPPRPAPTNRNWRWRRTPSRPTIIFSMPPKPRSNGWLGHHRSI
jgi:hypothetical protein